MQHKNVCLCHPMDRLLKLYSNLGKHEFGRDYTKRTYGFECHGKILCRKVW